MPAKYNYKGERRDSWINLVNLFLGLLMAGTPGAGKPYFVIRTSFNKKFDTLKEVIENFIITPVWLVALMDRERNTINIMQEAPQNPFGIRMNRFFYLVYWELVHRTQAWSREKPPIHCN